MTKRFIELGSTHIQDTLTGDKFYAPCEHKLCDTLNNLHDKNRRLESLIVEMLDYIKDKGAVTHNEMKEWWNNRITGDDR